MIDTKIGVCYYPEHWPRSQWAEQAANMAGGGIDLVRIAEFAWSRIEPARGDFQWEWLDEAIETLTQAGLRLIMCTPTACPPHWLIEAHPEILAVDQNGDVRGFGSRRHYRFASEVYRREAERICTAVIERYAGHPGIAGWQTDNEYGCHDTVVSYAEDDRVQFSHWLRQRYESIDALNEAWGTVFWSQEYSDFDKVGLPNLTVTEANPSHRLAYHRFASDQVVAFNQIHTKLLRDAAPASCWLTHNYMGNFVEFDHFDVAADLDVATWDSYPLGFLDQGWFTDDEKLRYRQIGHPDWAAFHHDLYRAVGGGRFGVIEQQPGPVNWAPANAMPVANAPAYWAMEAIAHGAELVSFFRYQQMPVAQEQMHAALRRPDGSPAPAWQSLRRLRKDLDALPERAVAQAPIALVFDYPSCWSTAIQPHAPDAHHLEWAFVFYSALRQLGLDIDIVSGRESLAGYKLIVLPGTVFVDDGLVDRIEHSGAACVIGPRSGSRTKEGAIPPQLAPGPLQRLVPLKVEAVDSMRRGAARVLAMGNGSHEVTRWFEKLDTALQPRLITEDGLGFWYHQGTHHYLNGFLSIPSLREILAEIVATAGIEARPLPSGLRRRTLGALEFAFNAEPETQAYKPPGGELICGHESLAQGEYAVWRIDNAR
ncbi:MAG: beta-galactosidase [Pseudomonadota bacterium]